MAVESWAVPRFADFLPLSESESRDIISYTNTLSDPEASQHLTELLGDSPEAGLFINSFLERRAHSKNQMSNYDKKQAMDGDVKQPIAAPSSTEKQANGSYGTHQNQNSSNGMQLQPPPAYAPPSGPPPSKAQNPSGPPPSKTPSKVAVRHHTNQVIEAAKVRAIDEQDMQQVLQNLQYRYGIYNSDIEPEHETDYPCGCPICSYQRRKWQRYGVQDLWSKAVKYPGTFANSCRGEDFGC